LAQDNSIMLPSLIRLIAMFGLAAVPVGLGGSAPATAQTAPKPAQGENQAAFGAFVESLWPDAKAKGVSRETFSAAFRGVTPDPKIVALTKKQSEFVQPIWGYLASAVGGSRLTRGKEVAAQWSSTLDAVEQRYGVPRAVVLGVWGMETNYGSFTGRWTSSGRSRPWPIRDTAASSSATTADALQILQGGLDRAAMKGSWAGAMGTRSSCRRAI
jgi:membrane-bound lytic murein transglycosylase B